MISATGYPQLDPTECSRAWITSWKLSWSLDFIPLCQSIISYQLFPGGKGVPIGWSQFTREWGNYEPCSQHFTAPGQWVHQPIRRIWDGHPLLQSTPLNCSDSLPFALSSLHVGTASIELWLVTIWGEILTRRLVGWTRAPTTVVGLRAKIILIISLFHHSF